VDKSATYVSTASNANPLVFSYTIASGDTTTTGITATTTALSLIATLLTLVCMIASFVIMIYLCYRLEGLQSSYQTIYPWWYSA
jgi:hypothetical protein